MLRGLEEKTRDQSFEVPPSPPLFARYIWYILIVSVFITDRRVMPDVFRDAGQVSSVLVLFIWGVVASSVCISRSPVKIGGALYRPFYLFLFITALSILLSSRAPITHYKGEILWIKSVKQFLHLLLSSSVFLLSAFFVKNVRDLVASIKWMVYPVVWLSAFVACIEVVHYYWPSATTLALGSLFHDKFSVYPVVTPMGRFPRINGLAWEPSMAGNYLLILWPFLAIGKLSRGTLGARVVERFTLVICYVLLFMTFSAGAYLVFVAQLSVLFLLIRKRSGYATAAAGALIAIVILWLSPIRDGLIHVVSRVLSISPGAIGDASARWRMIEYATAFNTFKKSPWVGVGVGNTVFYVLRDFPEWGLRFPGAWTRVFAMSGNPMAVNNLWLRVLAEVGLIGFIPFLVWHLRIARYGLLAVTCVQNEKYHALLVAMLVAFSGQMLHYFSLSGFQFKYWFLLAGLLGRASTMSRSLWTQSWCSSRSESVWLGRH